MRAPRQRSASRACALRLGAVAVGVVAFALQLLPHLPRLESPAAAYASPDSSAAPTPSLMQKIESKQRSGARLIRMDVTITRSDKSEETRRIVAVTRGSDRAVDLIFVVTAPQTLRGTTLLYHDAIDPSIPDTSWLYLPGFDAPRLIQSASMKLYVLGTGLTYEDSKGWISSDQYEFSETGSDSGIASIVARPKNDSLKTYLGYSKLDIRADEKRLGVLGVRFFDSAGGELKSYAASDFVVVGGAWLPRTTAVVHEVAQSGTVIASHYEALRKLPPLSLYSPVIEKESFLERLKTWMAAEGIAPEE